MPDITVSFTDAQWTRIVAASTYGADEHVAAGRYGDELCDTLASFTKSFI